MNLKFNVVIDLVALAVIFCVWLASRGQSWLRREDRRLFAWLLLAVALIFFVDIPAWLLDGSRFPGARVLLLLANTVYYVLQISFCYLWLLFADCWSSGGSQRLGRRWAWYAIPLVAELVLILFNIKTGWLFVLDEANVYHRGAYYLTNLLPYLLYIIGSIVLAIAGMMRVSPARRRQNASLLIFMFLPICGALLEAYSYGISWLWPFVALCLLMTYLEVQQQALAEERVRNDRQEQAARTAIMFSQIQPHFLYNSLTAISRLCEKNPHLAKEATIDFSAYLRANLDSLNQRELISFDTELDHLRTYLALEQLRFGDDLRVVYDIGVRDFRLPTLSVQPLVENAVKYGVGEKEEGGTVTLRTVETEDSYLVIVSDDGVGFDPATLQRDGRTHVGIQNVKSRLASQCGGQLSIVSEKGRGTVATVTIPKEIS